MRWKVILAYKLMPQERRYTLTRTQEAPDAIQAIHMVQKQLQAAEPRAYVVASDAALVKPK